MTLELPNSPVTSSTPDGSDIPQSSSDGSDTHESRSTRQPSSDDEWPAATENGQNLGKTALSTVPRQNNGVDETTTPLLNIIPSPDPISTTRNSDDITRNTPEDDSGKGEELNSADPHGRYSTANPDGHGSDSGHGHGESHSTTPITMDRSTHEGSDNGAGSADRLSTARASVSGAGALTTTSYETYLKDIKLNLNSDFSLSDLTPDQKRDLEALSDAYGLNVSCYFVIIALREI